MTNRMRGRLGDGEHVVKVIKVPGWVGQAMERRESYWKEFHSDTPPFIEVGDKENGIALVGVKGGRDELFGALQKLRAATWMTVAFISIESYGISSSDDDDEVRAETLDRLKKGEVNLKDLANQGWLERGLITESLQVIHCDVDGTFEHWNLPFKTNNDGEMEWDYLNFGSSEEDGNEINGMVPDVIKKIMAETPRLVETEEFIEGWKEFGWEEQDKDKQRLHMAAAVIGLLKSNDNAVKVFDEQLVQFMKPNKSTEDDQEKS